MKTLNILLFAPAILLFSGCYTQLMVQDNDPWTIAEQPVYIPPPDPILIYYPEYPAPGPIYVPPGGGGGSNPGGPIKITYPHRNSGDLRRGSDAAQQSSQDNSRNSGFTRNSGQNNSPQSSASSVATVPTRGNSGTQSSVPQRSSQDNSTSARRR